MRAAQPQAASAATAMALNWIGSQIDDSSVRSVTRSAAISASSVSCRSSASMPPTATRWCANEDRAYAIRGGHVPSLAALGQPESDQHDRQADQLQHAR